MSVILLTGCSNSKVDDNNNVFLGKNYDTYRFTCLDIDKNDKIDYFTGDLILVNGKIYEYLLNNDKSYSNGNNCKLLDEYDDFVNYDNYLIYYKKNDHYYMISSVRSYHEKIESPSVKIYFDKHIKKYLTSDNPQKDSEGNIFYNEFALKDDGNIYRIKKIQDKIVNEEIIYNKDEYGFIYNFYYNELYPEHNYIVSDKGYYYEKEIIKDNCDKYVDIECEKIMTVDNKKSKTLSEIRFYNSGCYLNKSDKIYCGI